MKIIIVFAFITLLACTKDHVVNPALTGSWLLSAATNQTGAWIDVTPGYGTPLVFGKNGSVSGIVGCGCVYAQTYRQKEQRIEFTYGGTPCPTIVACLPEPETEIVLITANELILKRGQYLYRYARK